jgi:hypothetical protein
MKRTTTIQLLGAAMVAAAVTPWLGGGVANAVAPPSGDTRAISYEGNAQVGDCTVGGLSGSDITNKVTAVVDATYIDITAVQAGYTVTGIVVKAGNAYNVYKPGQLGLPAKPPWNDLHGPLNPNEAEGGTPAGISHWYVCGITTPATTTSSAPVTTTSSAPVTTTSSAPVTTTSSGSASVLPSQATSSEAAETDVAVEGTKSGGSGALAETGAGMPLGAALAIGLGLLLGGAALILVPRHLAVERGTHRRRH